MQAQSSKENTILYPIKVLTAEEQVIDATITLSTEVRTDHPTSLVSMFSEDRIFIYEHKKGTYLKVFVITYHDTQNRHYEMVSDEVRSLFYVLRERLEQQGVQLLVQGARRHYYIIRHFKQDTRAIRLDLGKRYDYHSSEKINIFDPELDPSQLATVKEQGAYLEQWFESIIGVPY
ncbi:MAG: hypothetical protein Q3983_08780 [Capnocytophaga sp.]|nr:hypothetical protein [Capnocytophaga sp.]